MTDLLAARSQMALSLGFHIVFAAIGIAMPFLMALSHWRYLRTGREVYRDLTRAWSKGVAIFFATGAVSGTVLSFELGLLWPRFMELAGPVIGMPFSWEGTAFFLEAIFLGLFLYGWGRLPPRAHLAVGLMVGICGVASGIFVVCANAWMNAPAGFALAQGQAVRIDPFAAMFNPAWKAEALHMTLAAFEATGFAVAGVHALLWLRGARSRFHAEALRLALYLGTAAALLQPLSGDYSAKDIARRQPLKLAAVEGLFRTQAHAPITLGGWPSEADGRLRYGIEIPGLLSFLAQGEASAPVQGLEDFPRDRWPALGPLHWAFEAMVGCGTALASLGVAFLLLRIRRRALPPTFLALVAAAAPLGFLALEAGWTVTELGRQPWIIYGVMRTSEALTPMPGIRYSLALYSAVYLVLAALVAWLLARHIRKVPEAYASGREVGAP